MTDTTDNFQQLHENIYLYNLNIDLWYIINNMYCANLIKTI